MTCQQSIFFFFSDFLQISNYQLLETGKRLIFFFSMIYTSKKLPQVNWTPAALLPAPEDEGGGLIAVPMWNVGNGLFTYLTSVVPLFLISAAYHKKKILIFTVICYEPDICKF